MPPCWRQTAPDGTDSGIWWFARSGLATMLCQLRAGFAAFKTDLTEIENEYCHRTIEKLISKDQPKSTGRDYDMNHLSTDQLTYICLAVET
jgi:hypothetical protein